MDKDLFSNILDKDEEILLTFRPNKKRYVFVNIIICFILIFFIGFGLIAGGVIGYYIMGQDDLQVLLPLIFSGLAFIAVLIVRIIYVAVMFKRTIYAVSSKRLMIRTGFIGVDYKAFDMDMIGAMSVKVGLLDRLVKPATGTISLGNASAPMAIGAHNNKVSQFVFESIDDPYGTFRLIKEKIDDSRDI